MTDTTWQNRITGSGSEPPGQLLANPRNFRRHPQEQSSALKGVLTDVGWVQDVIVNQRTGFLVDGHLRVELALREGQTAVPVKYVDLSEHEEALILASLDPIAAMAAADTAALDALLAGIDSDNAEVLAFIEGLRDQHGIGAGTGVALTDPDDVPAAPETPITQPGDLWRLGEHRLLCGDATVEADVVRLIGDVAVSLLATDPPYNVGIDYISDGSKDHRSSDEYEAFTRAWFSVWQDMTTRQIVTPGCNNLASWLRWFDPYHVAPWTKTNAMTNGKVARWWCWEPILFFGEGWQRTRPNDVFDFPVPPQNAAGIGSLTGVHPCPKPLGMWADLLTCYSEPGDVVADAFAGSGTTLIAAEQTNRIALLMELSSAYCDVIVQRYEGFTGQTASRQRIEDAA